MDFRRVFDNVNYWKLFSLFLDDGTNTLIVCIGYLQYGIVIKGAVFDGTVQYLQGFTWVMELDREAFCLHTCSPDTSGTCSLLL